MNLINLCKSGIHRIPAVQCDERKKPGNSTFQWIWNHHVAPSFTSNSYHMKIASVQMLIKDYNRRKMRQQLLPSLSFYNVLKWIVPSYFFYVAQTHSPLKKHCPIDCLLWFWSSSLTHFLLSVCFAFYCLFFQSRLFFHRAWIEFRRFEWNQLKKWPKNRYISILNPCRSTRSGAWDTQLAKCRQLEWIFAHMTLGTYTP